MCIANQNHNAFLFMGFMNWTIFHESLKKYTDMQGKSKGYIIIQIIIIINILKKN